MTLAAHEYHRDAWVTLYCGDARELVPLLAADRIITDPVWPSMDRRIAVADPVGLLRDTLRDAVARSVTIQLGRMSDPRMLTAVPERWPFLCVSSLRYIPPSSRGRILNTADYAYTFGQPIASAPGRRVIPDGSISTRPDVPRGTGRNRTSAVFQVRQDTLPHPAARQSQHVRWLVRWFSDEGETVLDPFCGSGTTLLCAKNAGRRAIGIEIEPRSCAVAVTRLRQEILPGVGAPAPDTPRQESLTAELPPTAGSPVWP
jgi:site-specific DNA-methyltransferase (adenine-specific)